MHIDPEDDELAAPNRYLPLRSAVLERLSSLWASIDSARQIRKVNLHYLDGKLHVEIFLPLSALKDSAEPDELRRAFMQASKADKDIEDISLYFG